MNVRGDSDVGSQLKYEKHINVLNPIRLNLMIIPKYSTHLTLCAGDRGTFTLSDGHLLLRCRADT